MDTLPTAIMRVLRPFEAVFSERVWEWAKILLVGAILASGRRTVSAALRVMGLSEEAQFHYTAARVTSRKHYTEAYFVRPDRKPHRSMPYSRPSRGHSRATPDPESARAAGARQRLRRRWGRGSRRGGRGSRRSQPLGRSGCSFA
jgi:hypothetical protein